jgi:hypothetical protein
MEHEAKDRDQVVELLQKRISDLETRLGRLEKKLLQKTEADLSANSADPESLIVFPPATDRPSVSVESRIGGFGMAWLGNIVLLFGILFLTQLLSNNDQRLFSLVLGIAAAAGIYATGWFTRLSFPYLSKLFSYNGHVILFVTALRLYVLQGSRIIDSPLVGFGAVLLLLAVLMYLGFRRKSQLMTVIVWILTAVTAIASNSTHLMLALAVVIAGSAFYFALKYRGWTALVISIVLVYFTFLVWILGNPIMNGSFGIISAHQSGYIYLFICAFLYSMLGLFPKEKDVPVPVIHSSIVMNGIGFSTILAFIVLGFFTDNYAFYFGVIAAFCLGYSILLQSLGKWKVIASMYAIYSFVALSITIAGVYHFPLAYLLLAIQSLVVVIMALWFRSRFIVIMNTLLFVALLIAYLANAHTLVYIGFVFAGVALVTARIINWKKARLEIRTEMIRNTYLFVGASLLLYSLHESVPVHLITLSWVLSAMLFFIISVLIKNVKYRWLAIITMVVSVFYLFIVDLKNISLGYRIVALLFISAVSLGISIFYTRRHHQKEEETGQAG